MKAAANTTGSRVVRKIRIRAVLFLMLALVAGIGAVLLVKNYIDQMERRKAAVALSTTPVVVAAMAVPIGTLLEKQHLAIASWPAEYLPPGAYNNINAVVGKTVQQSLFKGEPVLYERLADEKSGKGLTAILPKGSRAMAVKVDQVVGVAGFVQPGDYVDVITTMAPDDDTRQSIRNRAAKVSKIILQNIKVLTVGEHMATKGTEPVKVQVVTLEVTPEQAERLALASRHGEIQLTMRSRIDQEQIATAGITPLDLLAPDQGAVEKKDNVAEAEKNTQMKVAALHRRKRKAEVEKKEQPAQPEPPVVEVLRGDRIEERKLRPTADSK